MTVTVMPAPVRPRTPSDRLRAARVNLALWTLQGWVAMFFIAAGYAKLTEPMDNLIHLMLWPARVSPEFVQGVGVVELLLAGGILAPLVSWSIGRPILLIATVGLIVLETFMLALHALGGDIGLSAVNAVLLVITVPIFLGRRRT